MEPTQEQQPQPEQSWREVSGSKQNPEADKRRHIIDKLKIKYPKRNMNLKAMVLNDLLSNFKPSSGDHHGDCCEERIKDRFHFVKKKETKTNRPRRQIDLKRKPFNKRTLLNLPGGHATLLDGAVRDLVTQIKSPNFAIRPDPSEFDINRGMLTVSCYDKTPREPTVEADVSEENSLEGTPEVAKKFENCSIDSNVHIMSAMDQLHYG